MSTQGGKAGWHLRLRLAERWPISGEEPTDDAATACNQARQAPDKSPLARVLRPRGTSRAFPLLRQKLVPR